MPLPGDDSDLGHYRPLADINVTPLVDVMLVMLVVFMVTAPMQSKPPPKAVLSNEDR